MCLSLPLCSPTNLISRITTDRAAPVYLIYFLLHYGRKNNEIKFSHNIALEISVSCSRKNANVIWTKFVFANTLFTSHFTFVFLPAKLKDWCEVEYRSVEVAWSQAAVAHWMEFVLQTINRRSCTIMEKAPTRAFSWLKAPTSAFTFNTLLRHYAKRELTPRSLNVKLGPWHKSQKGRAVWLA